MQQIEFHGVLRQVAGSKAIQLDNVGPGATVGQVLEQLASSHPALAPHLPRVACAQGDSLIRLADPVDPARALVLLPPVSGG